jgi:hypothetical protein
MFWLHRHKGKLTDRSKFLIRKGGNIMKVRLFGLVLLTLAVLLASHSWGVAHAADKDVPRIEKDTLKGWLGDPNVLVIDVRADNDWKASDKKIKGAVRQDPKEVKGWASSLSKEKRIVLY